jgi:hypothetical protein
MPQGSAHCRVSESQVLSVSQSAASKHSTQRPLGTSQNGRPPLVQSVLELHTPAAPAAPPAVPAAPPDALAAPPPQSGAPASAQAAPVPPPAPLKRAISPSSQPLTAAVAARRRGDEKTALALLDELLSKHPTTPLAPEARVERFRALKRLGRESEAAREASRYLLEHESGPAREEAREIVLPAAP